MEKRKWVPVFVSGCLVLMMVVLALMAACAKPAPAPTPTPPEVKPIELSLNTFYGPNDILSVYGSVPWANELEKRSGGRLKVVHHYSCSLSSIEEIYDSVVRGVADLGIGYTMGTPGRFPMSDVMGFTPIDKMSQRAGRVSWELYKEFPEMRAEFADTKMLFLFCTPTSVLYLRDKQVERLEDLKGLKITSAGGFIGEKTKLLGASSLTIPYPDIYMSLQKGVIDGAICSLDTGGSMNFGEITKYCLEVDFGYTQMYLVMNPHTWDSLPSDLQKILDEVSGDYGADLMDRAYWGGWEAMKPGVEALGTKFYTLSPEEMAKWAGVIKPVTDQFAAGLEAKGLPGKKLVEECERLHTQY